MHLCCRLLLFTVLVSFAIAARKLKLPSYVKLCSQDDPQLLQCFKEAVEVIRPHLKDGIPEMQLPSMNPLVIPEVSLNAGDTFKAKFKNIEIYHTHNFILKDLNVDLPTNHVEMFLEFPILRIKAQYEINGRILVLQLRGTGPADGNYTDVTAHLDASGVREFRNGKEYIKIVNNTLDFNIGKAVLYFEGIFGNNEELNDQTNRVINQNIDQIIEELRPVLNDVVRQFTTAIVGRVFDRFSFDELFPKHLEHS